MRYLYKSLKSVSSGKRVKVEFDKPVKVLLLDPSQYKRYKGGISYSYYGGNAEVSPAMVKIPRKGDWNIVVETGSYFEDRVVNVTIELLPPGDIVNSLEKPKSELAEEVDRILDEADDNSESFEAVEDEVDSDK